MNNGKLTDRTGRIETALENMALRMVGRVCVLGIGNRERGDDGAGSLVAGGLRSGGAMAAIDAGMAPENHLEMVARTEPDTVVVVDAVDFGGAPGELRTLHGHEIGRGGLSTHAPSLAMTMDYLVARTGARLLLLGIQPAALGSNRELSIEVSRTVDRVRDFLAQLQDIKRKNV